MKFPNTAFGFTIVESLVGLSIMMVMALGMASLLTDMRSQLSTVEMKLEQQSLRANLQASLLNAQNCMYTVSTLSIPTSSLTVGNKLTLPTNKIMMNGQPLTNLKSPFFESYTVTYDVLAVPAPATAFGVLRVVANPKPQFSSRVLLAPIEFPFSFNLDAAGFITDCPAMVTEGGQLWGQASIAPSSSGSQYVSFPPSRFTIPPKVLISPNWTRRSFSENTAWWISGLSTLGFTINWSGPPSGTDYGIAGVSWFATP